MASISRMKLLIGSAVIAFAIVGCSALPGTDPGASSPPPDLTLAPSGSLPDLGEVPADLFARAAQEAAAAANVAVEQVTIVRAQAANWPTPALGCPDPDMMYTQVITPGYWLVLRAGDQEFDFRASERGALQLCPPGQGEPPVDDQ